jgi:hypothetical protein
MGFSLAALNPAAALAKARAVAQNAAAKVVAAKQAIQTRTVAAVKNAVAAAKQFIKEKAIPAAQKVAAKAVAAKEAIKSRTVAAVKKIVAAVKKIASATKKVADEKVCCPLNDKPLSPPSGNALLADPSVNAALKEAATESNIGGKNPVEQGGVILRDPKTGELSTARYPSGEGASIMPFISKDGMHNGKEIIASFHTHPNVGDEWDPKPSPADVNFVKNYTKSVGNEHFVISRDTIYRIGPDGKVTESGETSKLLK